MDWASKEIVGVIYHLLPGFLAAWVFYGLTAHPRREAFERVVQALIFTFIVKAVTIVVRQKLLFGTRLYDFGLSAEDAGLVWSLIIAVLVGLIFAYLANSDWLHWLLRKARITSRTSHPSEWFSAFRRGDRWCVLHLVGGRRLHGWAEEWPDQHEAGHFLIQQPKWVLDNGPCVPVIQTYRMIIKATDVEMVEQVCDRPEVKETDEVIAERQKPLAALFVTSKESSNGK